MNNIQWTCYPINVIPAKILENFEKNEIALPIGEKIKYESDAIPNPNVLEQFVFPANVMNKIKVYKSTMFGSPLRSDVFNIGRNTFRFADLGEYDSASSYTIGNIVSFVDETDIIDKIRNGIIDETRNGIIDETRNGIIDETRNGIIDESRHGIIDETRYGIIDETRYGIIDETRKLSNIKKFVNLVVIPGKKLNNPITDSYAWVPFKYADSN